MFTGKDNKYKEQEKKLCLSSVSKAKISIFLLLCSHNFMVTLLSLGRMFFIICSFLKESFNILGNTLILLYCQELDE